MPGAGVIEKCINTLVIITRDNMEMIILAKLKLYGIDKELIPMVQQDKKRTYVLILVLRAPFMVHIFI